LRCWSAPTRGRCVRWQGVRSRIYRLPKDVCWVDYSWRSVDLMPITSRLFDLSNQMPQERKGYRLVLGFVWVVKNRHARNKVSSGDTVLSMNAFWNFFDTLLGLGADPKDLTFVSISLRVFIC